MDFEALFWIILAVVYLVLQLLSARKQREGQEPPQGPAPDDLSHERAERPGRAPTDLDEALREIREALGQPAAPRPKPRPQPRPETRSEPAPTPKPQRPLRTPKPVGRTPKPVGRAPDTGFRREETFETAMPRPAPAPPIIATGEQPALESLPVDIYEAPPDTGRAPSALRQAVVEQLRGRDSLRRAMLLHEVLGPPRSRRGPHRP